MYAIIETGGKQYKVSVGDIIKIEKIEASVGQQITFDKILLFVDSDVVTGNPTIAGKSVTATVLSQGRAKKVVVYRYKRKSGYHKKNGHRQCYTEVKIENII